MFLAPVKAIAVLHRYARQRSAVEGRSKDLQTATDKPCPSVDCQSDGSEWKPASIAVSSSDEADADDLPHAESARQRAQVLDSPAAAAKARSNTKSVSKTSRPSRRPARQRRSKFVAGRDRASSSDTDDLEDFLAPDTDEEDGKNSRSMVRKSAQTKAKQSRSTREKLDWSESSASDSQQAAEACKNTKGKLRGGRPSSGASNQQVAADDEEEPQPVKRNRPLAHVLDGEEGWDASLPDHIAPSQPQIRDSSDSDNPAVLSNKRRRLSTANDAAPTASIVDDQQGPDSLGRAVDLTQASEDAEHPSTAPAVDAEQGTCQDQQQSADSHAAAQHANSHAEDEAQASRGPQHSGHAENAAQLSSDHVQQASLRDAATTGSSDSDDMPQASRKRRRPNNSLTVAQQLPDELQEENELVDVATQLAEEGLDPLPEETSGHRSSRRTNTGKPSRPDMRARIQQHQQKLRQGSKRQRRSRADSFLDNQIQHVWDGSATRPPSDSDSEFSSSEATSASAESASEADNADADSDLDDFIVDDAGPSERGLAGARSGGDHNDGDSRQDLDNGGEELDDWGAANQPQSILQQAGFGMRQSDGDYFRTYIEYLVYDLVDKTFAVRVATDTSLQQYYTGAIKRIEERMADRRDMCVVSSAWQQAVAGLMEHLDTLPGLSSEWTESSDTHEDRLKQGGVCQACQKGQTLNHAVKTLTLKGKPYKPLWKYGYRRVSDAHVRNQLPYKDDGSSSQDEQQDPDDGREEHKYAMGRMCCARIQMYHALMHYKYRLRGKLKKRIKKEYSLQRLEHRKQDWVEAANSFLAKDHLIRNLHKNYSSLIDTATNFNTQLGANWRTAMNTLTNSVDTLLYQLNSDDEGDEGSDIGAQEEEEAQDRSGDEEAEGAASEGNSRKQAEANAEPQTHASQDRQQPGIGARGKDASKPKDHSQSQAQPRTIDVCNQHQTDAEASDAAVAAQSPNMDSEPELAADLSLRAQHPAVRQPGLADSSAASMPSSSQEAGVNAIAPSQQTTLFNDSEPLGTVEASTMPYDAAINGTQAAEQAGSNQQHLPEADTVKADIRSQGVDQESAEEAAGIQATSSLLDLTEGEANQQHSLLHDADDAARSKDAHHQQLKSQAAATPSRRASTGSVALSPGSSAKKHRQADIRNFFKSP